VGNTGEFSRLCSVGHRTGLTPLSPGSLADGLLLLRDFRYLRAEKKSLPD
jgi:hypothetical protein